MIRTAPMYIAVRRSSFRFSDKECKSRCRLRFLNKLFSYPDMEKRHIYITVM